MKQYLVKWPDGSFAVAGASNLYDLFWIVDEIDDPFCASYCRLPSTEFCWDSVDGWDERHDLRPAAWTTGTELFEKVEVCQIAR